MGSSLGDLRTKKLANQHKRPSLHIDLSETNPFIAAGKIINWIAAHGIEILNIAGSRASKDPLIYQESLKVLKAVYYMDIVDEAMPDPQRISPLLPRTIEEALEILLEKMPLKDQVSLARLPEEDLVYLHPQLGAWIRDRFELSLGNIALMGSCREAAGKDLDADSASFLIIRKLWERLISSHSLRMVQRNGKGHKRP